MTPTKRKAEEAEAEERDTIEQPEVGVGDALSTNDIDQSYTPPVFPPGDPLTTHEVDALETAPAPENEAVITTHELDPLEAEG